MDTACVGSTRWPANEAGRQPQTFEWSSASRKDEDVHCQSSSTRAHGGGLVTGANAAAGLGNIVVDQMRVRTPTLPQTARVQAFETTPRRAPGGVPAHLICAI